MINPSQYIDSVKLDLSCVSEVDLVNELARRNVPLDYVASAYYALGGMNDAMHDRLYGNGEEGQHGPNANK